MANPEIAYEHAGTAAPTTLAFSITNSATSFTAVDGTGYPTGAGGSFFITLERGTISYERVLCSQRVGNVFTVAANGRGVDGTVAQSHAANGVVEHTWSSTEADQLSQHVSKKSGVHGATTDLVGKDDTVSLTNKTLVTPVISSFVNATHDHGNATGGGAVPSASVTGLAASLAALSAADATKQGTAEKSQANGYPTLDSGGLVPYAQLPVGAGAAQVSQGTHTHGLITHTHRIQSPTRTFGLTERNFADGDPIKTLATLVVGAGRYLVIAQCKGLTAAANDNTGFQYDISASGQDLLWAVVETHRKASTTLGEGCNMQAYMTCSGSTTISFTGEKLGNGALLTNSTLGQLIAIPLSALEID